MVSGWKPSCPGFGLFPGKAEPGIDFLGAVMKSQTVFAAAVLLVILVVAGIVEGRKPQPIPLIPTQSGQVEYCLTCHNDLPEISAAHPVDSFGCVRCHGGERLALDADLAHSTMRGGANPSNLAVVEESCGGSDCHSGEVAAQRDHIQRVLTSLQSTYAGAIAQLRFSFGAQPDLTAIYGIQAVEASQPAIPPALPYLFAWDHTQESSPALQMFGSNCLTCHLHAEALDGPQYNRFSGCSACHTPNAGADTEQTVHRLTTAIPYTQCNTCHNRGNYDLRSMKFQERSDQPKDRLHDYYQPISQFTRCEYTLDCIDCHTRQEAMGDGNIYSQKKEIQYIQCRTCHGDLQELPKTAVIQSEDDLAFKLAFLNPAIDLKVGDTILVTAEGELLWNIRQLPDGNYELFGKATGQLFTFRAVKGTDCEQNPEQQESRYCHECHAVER
jgi:hypothetical protein